MLLLYYYAVPPFVTILAESSTLQYQRGETLTLNARVSFNNPLNSVTWMRGGNTLSASNHRISLMNTFFNGSLNTMISITPLRADDAGQYTVVATNAAGSGTSEQLSVIVLGTVIAASAVNM